VSVESVRTNLHVFGKRATKVVADVCKESKFILYFPKYPSSGDLHNTEKYPNIDTFGGKDADACNDDYELVTKKERPSQNDASKLYDAEHVLDAQLIKEFFGKQCEGQSPARFPRTWRKTLTVDGLKAGESNRGGRISYTPPTGAEYFSEWWSRRVSQDTRISASTYLLKVDPGWKEGSLPNDYINEIFLLERRLNQHKNTLMHSRNQNLIDPKKWAKWDHNVKINELRRWILLVQVSQSSHATCGS